MKQSRALLSILVLLMLVLGGQRAFSVNVIYTDTIIPTSTCPGGYLVIPFHVDTADFTFGTTFYAEWSDANGNFDNPDTVGSIPFILGNNGIIPGQIPDDAGFGINYRIRVRASEAHTIGQESPFPIFVTSLPILANITALPLAEQCTGEEVTLIAGIGFGGSYQWSTGDSTGTITVTDPGTYSVTVNFLGCDNESDPYELNMLPRPATPTVSIHGDGVLESSPEEGYQWYLNGTAVDGATNVTHWPGESGEYSVVVTDGNGCESLPSEPVFHVHGLPGSGAQWPEPPRDTITGWTEVFLPQDSTIIIDPPIGPDPPLDFSVRVYPIPTDDILNIETRTTTKERIFYVLYDAKGQVRYISPRNIVLGEYDSYIDMTGMAEGMYNLQLFVRGTVRSYNVLKLR